MEDVLRFGTWLWVMAPLILAILGRWTGPPRGVDSVHSTRGQPEGSKVP